jgi:hypothetical protein
MLLHFIFGLVALLTGASACLFILFVLGIRRGDHGKRLTGKPGSRTEVLARRVLTGSRGCDARNNEGEDR